MRSLVVAALAGLTLAQGDQSTVPGGSINQFNGTVDQFIAQNSTFSYLSKAVNMTQLNTTSSAGNVTFFAPNNNAITTLPPWLLQRMGGGSVGGSQDGGSSGNASFTPAIAALLLYHIEPNGTVGPQNFTTGAGGGGNVSTSGLFSSVEAYVRYLQGGGGNQTNQTSQAFSIPTALYPLNLSGYANASNWFVNDAQVVSVTQASNGYVFELSKIVTPLFYFNYTIYGSPEPARLDSNYTAPPPTTQPPINVTAAEERFYAQQVEAYNAEMDDWRIGNALGVY